MCACACCAAQLPASWPNPTRLPHAKPQRNATPPRISGKRNRPAAPPTRYSELPGEVVGEVLGKFKGSTGNMPPGLPGLDGAVWRRSVVWSWPIGRAGFENMLYFANWKVLVICAACAAGLLLAIPNLFTEAQLAALPSWLPHKQLSLGLDLRGGSYLLLQ